MVALGHGQDGRGRGGNRGHRGERGGGRGRGRGARQGGGEGLRVPSHLIPVDSEEYQWIHQADRICSLVCLHLHIPL